jgi:hypothetical protein
VPKFKLSNDRVITYRIEEVITDRQLFSEEQLVGKRIQRCVIFRDHGASDQKVALIFEGDTYAFFGFEQDFDHNSVDLNMTEIPHYKDLQRLGLLSQEEFVRAESNANRYYNSADKKARRQKYEELKAEFENEKV